jgi:long-chain acyl-CoA synthetase
MRTVPELLLSRFDDQPERPAFFVRNGELDGFGGEPARAPGWTLFRRGVALDLVSGLARRLSSLGVGPGVRVAVVAETSARWLAVDLAVLCLGGVMVGVYPGALPAEVREVLADSGAAVLIAEDAAMLARLGPELDALPALVQVLTFEDGPGARPLLPAAADRAFLRAQAAAVRGEDLATLVYTSGTTGRSKGVRLTHHNLVAVVEATQAALPMGPGERSIVFLPMAHVLQRVAVYRGLLEDLEGWFSRIDDLVDTMAVARPTVLATVPRMLEKIRQTAEATAAARGARAKTIFDHAFRVGRAAAELRRAGRPLPASLRVQHALADRLVFARVRERLGGSLRLLVSGGAALHPDDAGWFEALGVTVCEGYGLTETSAPATTNRPGAARLGTVGQPLPGVALRLDADGEVLVRGPGVFSGYEGDPASTAAAFTADGFFRTGDIGVLDPDGFLRIVDRKKELLVTAGGKNVAPVPIEAALVGDGVAQAVLVGSERPYLVALLALDPEHPAAADRASAALRAGIDARVAAVNARLPAYATVKRWALLPGPLQVETGELTPTLKLRRREILRRHAALIAALYDGGRGAGGAGGA